MKIKGKSIVTFLIIAILVNITSVCLAANSDYARSNSYSNYTKTEQILQYQSDITVQTNGEVLVKETIQVYATGNNIKRGIYREFPTRYKTKNGNYQVAFDVLGVKKDGKEEKYKIEKVSNGKRIRIGDANSSLLPYKSYTYEITYKTNRQIGFFENFDEIYWNVTGNGWDFPIQQVTAVVHLPEAVSMKNIENNAYTGAQGSKDQNYTVDVDELAHTVTFQSTKKLYKGEGFTISTTFEKGIVEAPGVTDNILYYIKDNIVVVILSIGLLMSIVMVVVNYKKIEKVDRNRTVVPTYYPPKGFSPAEVKFLDGMGKDIGIEGMSASILNLAVNGYLKLEDGETKKKKKPPIKIIKTEKSLGNEVSQEEREIYQTLENETTLEYSSSLQAKLSNMKTNEQKTLKDKMEEVFYHKNTKLKNRVYWVGVIFLIIGLLISTQFEFSELFQNGIMSIMLYSVASIFISPIADKITKKRKSTKTSAGIIFLYLFFMLVAFMFCMALIETPGLGVFVIFLLLYECVFLTNTSLMEQYTQEGARIIDEIDGFKMFITTASGDEILHLTPEMFDQYFPYAYALGLQNKWAKKFETVLQEAQYEPQWYSGVYLSHGVFSATVFTQSFSSGFSSSISSSSTAPGSSSGSGGGGFSGGGGGRRPEVVVGNTTIRIIKDYQFIKNGW